MPTHGKKYRNSLEGVDLTQRFSVEDAVAKSLGASFAKFDETVDVALRLGVDPKYSDQMVRGAVPLPNGLGKTVRVAVFCKGEKQAEAREAGADFVGAEDLIDKIKEGWLDFDAAIAALDVNRDTEASSTAYTDQQYSSVSATIRDWVIDSARKEGDKTVIANTSTSTDDDGKETTTTQGYYAVFFTGSNDNTFPLVNVRHILIKFEGGTTDSTTGTTTYSDEEKEAAKQKAEEILDEWMSGDATEDSFAALANEKSDDGNGTTGGLYENVYPGQMVSSFNDWCFDESRQPGDTGIVETSYGVHVMYFDGFGNSYRNTLVENALRTADYNAWHDGVVGDNTYTTASFGMKFTTK